MRKKITACINCVNAIYCSFNMAYTDGTREVLLVLDNERPPQYDSPNDATVKPPEYSSEKYSSENHVSNLRCRWGPFLFN